MSDTERDEMPAPLRMWLKGTVSRDPDPTAEVKIRTIDAGTGQEDR